jgi:hypothetical protein
MAEKDQQNCMNHYLRLYSMERKERPWKIFQDRFGAYYHECLRGWIEFILSVNSNNDISISGEKLPPLFDELPALEEDAVSTPQDLTSHAWSPSRKNSHQILREKDDITRCGP